MVRMFGIVNNVYFEAVFLRPDGELEPIFENVLIVRGSSTEQLIKTISQSVNTDGTIHIYKITDGNNLSRLHKIIEVYNDLDLVCN